MGVLFEQSFISPCSLWLLMTGDSSGGVLMAKTTDSGANTVYGLEITPNGGDFIIRFSYLPASRSVLLKVDFNFCYLID